MSNRARARLQSGFTLLEVLISMVILSFIAYAIYQATTETFKLRDSLSVEGDFYNGVRMSMNIMDRDITALFSPLSFVEIKKKPDDKDKSADPNNPNASVDPNAGAKPPSDDPKEAAFLSGNKGQATKFWSAATDKTGIRTSRFQGEQSKMSFISSSYLRVYKEKPESDLAKITYEVEASKDPDAPGTYVLIRTESPNVFQDDDDKDQFRRRFPLLGGIKSFKVTYYRRKSPKEWEKLSNWDTEKADLKDKYPDKIEVTLEVTGGPRLNYDGIYVFRPEMPFRGVAKTL